MAEPRLGPEELDRLEDALEDLEFAEAITDPSEAVSQRLADFRTILQASREAMPLEEVPSGLLEGVISEARMSAEDIQTPPPQPAKEGLWARLRRTWLIPGLAVAGSAALVLLLVQPTLQSDEPAQSEVGAVAMKDEPAKQSAPASPAPAEPAMDGDSERQMADEEAPPPPPAEANLEMPGGAAASADAEAEPAVEPEPEAKPLEKKLVDDGWNAIEQGDSARKGGDCFTARNHYARALDDGNDSVRARAYVGLGMCKQEEGNDAAARDYFEKARELDEDAVDFANTQSKSRAKRRPRPRSKKPSSKRKSAMDLDDAKAEDPFSGL